jgi:hypothetical protein
MWKWFFLTKIIRSIERSARTSRFNVLMPENPGVNTVYTQSNQLLSKYLLSPNSETEMRVLHPKKKIVIDNKSRQKTQLATSRIKRN